MLKHIALFILLLIASCAPRIPIADLTKVSELQRAAALNIRVFTIGSGANYPEIQAIIGPVKAFSCKHLLTDPPASKGDALMRLRLEALKLEANGIIDVTFDLRGTDAWGTNCWETVQASGLAVRFK